MKPLKIFIGYDPKETVTYHVLAQSILRRASGPVLICPVNLANLKAIYTRPRESKQSTEFTFSRFLTPFLSDYDRVSIFMDSDMLCLCDIWELAQAALDNPYCDVLVVKHDYLPKAGKKFLGQEQTVYPCKNWSSLMVFNGHRASVRKLTPEFVNKASPMELHQFKWAQDVGELPGEFNHLVGEYPCNVNAKIVHYTLGAPCFRSYQACEFSAEWFKELGEMTHCDDPILELVQDADLSRRGNAGAGRLLEPHHIQRASEAGDSGGDPSS